MSQDYNYLHQDDLDTFKWEFVESSDLENSMSADSTYTDLDYYNDPDYDLSDDRFILDEWTEDEYDDDDLDLSDDEDEDDDWGDDDDDDYYDDEEDEWADVDDDFFDDDDDDDDY